MTTAIPIELAVGQLDLGHRQLRSTESVPPTVATSVRNRAPVVSRRRPRRAPPFASASATGYPRRRLPDRLLIVVGQAAPDAAQIPDGVRLLIDHAKEILVVSPMLPGRLDWLSSATDTARHEADERLRSVLGHLEDLGADAEGEIGADDPLLAFEDAVAKFSPDHLLIGLRDEDRAGWQERGLLQALNERFRVPITVFDVPAA